MTKELRHGFVLGGGPGFCNAIRRSLLSDLVAEAPCEVEVRRNTSCQTDEFLAHRIGQIPFRRVGNGDTMDLRVEGRSAWSSALTGCAFEPCVEVEIMRLIGDQALELTVHFDEGTGRKHARYCRAAGVGMERVGSEHRIEFEMIDGSDAKSWLRKAVEAFDSRLDAALLELAHTDRPPPASMC